MAGPDTEACGGRVGDLICVLRCKPQLAPPVMGKPPGTRLRIFYQLYIMTCSLLYDSLQFLLRNFKSNM